MNRARTLAFAACLLFSFSEAWAQPSSNGSLFGFNTTTENRAINVSATCQAPDATPIGDCKDDPKGDVVIGSGASAKCTGTVIVPETIAVGNIAINSGGSLIIADGSAAHKPVELTTKGMDIKSGGSFMVGSATCPIGTSGTGDEVTRDKVIVRFIGEKPTTCGALDLSQPLCQGFVKGIQVESGGTLGMWGVKGVPTSANNGVNWTYLSQPAGNPKEYNKAKNVLEPPPGDKAADAKVIYTAARVDDESGGAGPAAWQRKDWIVVATTSFSPWESEFVEIAKVVKDPTPGATGSMITLATPLEYYHFGGADPGDPSTDANYMAGSDPNPAKNQNFGVDERAEVGLISRNILLTSNSDEPNGGRHWGGELKFLNGFTAVSLQGVELQKFGKEQLGSYPIHFHLDGNVSNSTVLIDSNSIDHSYNKCITTHSTQNIIYTNNVCARITGHIFYEEVGDESNVTFKGNLGIGAMSNSFDVNTTAEKNRETLINEYYWKGDRMFKHPGAGGDRPVFDQFNIFDADNQYVNNQPNVGAPFVSPRGTCGTLTPANADGPIPAQANGAITLTGSTPKDQTISCYPGNNAPSPPGSGNIYFEPPSGFWLLNPSATLQNNSIAGCQDTGAAYWYATPPDPNPSAVKFIPIGTGTTYNNPHGTFQNNRGHSCYRGLNDDQFEVSTADQLFGYQNSQFNTGPPDFTPSEPQVDEFDGLTLSRIRYRGVWLRPSFFYLKDARLATNRRGISFVTSGGADGNYPGVWSLLGHSTMVGVSTNNVDRFGPCGNRIIVNGVGQVRGAQYGCIDQTVPKGWPKDGKPTGGEFTENGFPTPDNNMFGFMSYDGPPLMVKDRFVNFLQQPAATLWTTTDRDVASTWGYVNAYKHYEGDAAIGWLDSNQSAYPTAATTDQLSFTNVDFRHQVYTEGVNIGQFNDGDQNTSIIDLDGTLSGYLAKTSPSSETTFGAASLNDLPFNQSANSVDECHSTGQQNIDVENGRPTAAMIPTGVGQLEFEALYPKNGPPWPPVNPDPNAFQPNYSQLLTFYKDDLDFGQHGAMALHSRNGNGIWEPKVVSGYGYVVRADPYTTPAYGTSGVGIPPMVDISLVDTVSPGISSTNPFYTQLGICYSNADKSHPADNFTVTHGYKSWGGGNVQITDPALRQYFNQLQNLYNSETCFNLDSQVTLNLTSCPADGVTLQENGSCPSGTTAFTDGQGKPACRFPKNTPALTEATSLAGMTMDGTLNGPPNLTKYFYDSGTGMLYLWIMQADANAIGPSPLGNCSGDDSADEPFCPQNSGVSTGESYYNCPAEGCPTYRVVLNSSYTPGQSTCPVFGSTGNANGWATGTAGSTWTKPPANLPVLVYADTSDTVTRAQPPTGNFPYYPDANPPACPLNQ
jgi:hypothetical protein